MLRYRIQNETRQSNRENLSRMKMTRWSVFVLTVIFFSVSNGVFLHAQSVDEVNVALREQELRAELANLERAIELEQKVLDDRRRESQSIERDIDILTAQINKSRLSIRSKNIAIESLGSDIDSKTRQITNLDERLEIGKDSLADLIRKTQEIDSYSLVEIMLSKQDLSEFLSDVDSYSSIKSSLNALFVEIRDLRLETEEEREALDQKRRAEIDARAVIEEERRSIERNEREKQQLLAVSKNSEQTQAEYVAQQERRAAQIRSALFALRDTAAIPFGDALRYANGASAKTGVRSALILAILTQETNLGENVGTCNRAGDPPSKSWREIMKPSRDQEPYLEIVGELGLNPDTMPLSCPWGNGWGGAMGPSQFIPSTWMMYKKRIAQVTGNNPPNPWDPEDAITATTLFLTDLGAGEGGYSAEREAALRYYAGGNWNKPQNAFYGDQVMRKAQDIQENMIDPLENF
ncbi:MAG: lytic murein transglycosylase [Candidatus Paceibacterota bacterium]